MRYRITVLALIILLMVAGASHAWWAGGHGAMTRAAVLKLPADMPDFFAAGVEQLAEMSLEPDNWKSQTTPRLRSTEQPEHFIDLEYLDGAPLPELRYDLVKLYAAKNIDIARGGYLPYALMEGYERLMLAFREHRNRPDAVSVQQRILVYAGWLAHYCQDASMPLHATKNFDGKSGKDGAITQKGIHARIDSYPEKNGFTPEVLSETVQANATVNVWPVIVKAIQASYAEVEKCYELDAAGAFEGQPAKGRELMLQRSRAAVQLTVDLWYSAWKNSDPAKAGIR